MKVLGIIINKSFKFIKWFFIISVVSVLVFRFIPIPITPTMLYLLGEQAFDSERKIVLKKDWESLSNISPNMKLAVIAAEDQLFYEHFGFDFIAIKKAMRNNERGRRLKGGSTISQQTAKNAFLLPHRSYIRKGLEAYFTMLIELLWSKDRIIEVYLNVIEFGNGIYGVEAASQHYFKKPASKLNKDEASLLASVLPNPIRFKVDRPSGYVLRRKNWIKRQIGRMGLPIEDFN
jgi:monofunctional biosynthetic peptidoglycan transglycosylase